MAILCKNITCDGLTIGTTNILNELNNKLTNNTTQFITCNVFNKHYDNFYSLYKLYIRINKFENYEQEELNNLLVFCIVFIHKGCIIYYFNKYKRKEINILILNVRV